MGILDSIVLWWRALLMGKANRMYLLFSLLIKFSHPLGNENYGVIN